MIHNKYPSSGIDIHFMYIINLRTHLYLLKGILILITNENKLNVHLKSVYIKHNTLNKNIINIHY